VQAGVAEQNLVTVAAGLAAMGKVPFCSSYAMFSPGRNWEQIRTTACYNDQKVVVVGSHAGVSVGPDGGTHQALEDIALMRILPNMTVLYPCDMHEAHKATLAAAECKGPVYLRLAREKSAVMTTPETPFELGKAQVVWEPDSGLAHVGVVSTGPLLHKALLAAKELEKKGIKVKILNYHTVKPFDSEAVIALAKETKAIVTIEEHQVAGGFGSVVSEVLSQQYPVPIEFIGVHDHYGQSGKPEELIEHYGMGTKSVAEAIVKVLNRKNG
jgi:transketolase